MGSTISDEMSLLSAVEAGSIVEHFLSFIWREGVDVGRVHLGRERVDVHRVGVPVRSVWGEGMEISVVVGAIVPSEVSKSSMLCHDPVEFDDVCDPFFESVWFVQGCFHLLNYFRTDDSFEVIDGDDVVC